MALIHRIWNDLAQDESGQDLIEYALIAAVVGTAAVASLHSIAQTIATVLGNVQANLTTMTT